MNHRIGGVSLMCWLRIKDDWLLSGTTRAESDVVAAGDLAWEGCDSASWLG